MFSIILEHAPKELCEEIFEILQGLGFADAPNKKHRDKVLVGVRVNLKDKHYTQFPKDCNEYHTPGMLYLNAESPSRMERIIELLSSISN